jgi:hypothetical protein
MRLITDKTLGLSILPRDRFARPATAGLEALTGSARNRMVLGVGSGAHRPGPTAGGGALGLLDLSGHVGGLQKVAAGLRSCSKQPGLDAVELS